MGGGFGGTGLVAAVVVDLDGVEQFGHRDVPVLGGEVAIVGGTVTPSPTLAKEAVFAIGVTTEFIAVEELKEAKEFGKVEGLIAIEIGGVNGGLLVGAFQEGESSGELGFVEGLGFEGLGEISTFHEIFG